LGEGTGGHEKEPKGSSGPLETPSEKGKRDELIEVSKVGKQEPKGKSSQKAVITPRETQESKWDEWNQEVDEHKDDGGYWGRAMADVPA